MKNPAFIITIDTEGDNLWQSPHNITCENAKYLPRFQDLCEKYGFKPTYLTNYEMASDIYFKNFARTVLEKRTGEVGMHLHAWNSPPEYALTRDDFQYTPYLIEYPVEVMRRKISRLTDLLQDTFGQKMISHRAGRWAFNATYAELLREYGYLVDCSVTPGVDWSLTKGDPDGHGGTNYTNFLRKAYFMHPHDIAKEGNTNLLQVPMTILPKHSYVVERIKTAVNKVRGKKKPRSMSWLRPKGGNAKEMICLANHLLAQGSDYIEFMLHSSEFMPGGSPSFKDKESIEQLYHDLEELFIHLSGRCTGMTLKEYRDYFINK